MDGGKAEVSAVNSRNAETVLMALMAATVLWEGFSLYRQIKHRNRAAMSRRKLIFAAIRALLPMLILALLSPIVTFIGGGRVLPWHGIWMTLPSVMLWLGLLSLAKHRKLRLPLRAVSKNAPRIGNIRITKKTPGIPVFFRFLKRPTQ